MRYLAGPERAPWRAREWTRHASYERTRHASAASLWPLAGGEGNGHCSPKTMAHWHREREPKGDRRESLEQWRRRAGVVLTGAPSRALPCAGQAPPGYRERSNQDRSFLLRTTLPFEAPWLCPGAGVALGRACSLLSQAAEVRPVRQTALQALE
jgi:hypothetical protein